MGGAEEEGPARAKLRESRPAVTNYQPGASFGFVGVPTNQELRQGEALGRRFGEMIK